MSLPGCDSWRTGPFGRFERAEERRDEVYALALSERDSELREDADLLAEVVADRFFAGDEPFDRWLAILQAAACHKPASEVGAALTRLVNDIIDAEARRRAGEDIS